MSITLNFELNDRDLAHFQAAMDRSKQAAEGKEIGDTTTLADTAVMQTISQRVRDERA